MSESSQLIVVRGGPAGLVTAEAAALRGIDTVVLERRAEIGHPVRTTGSSWVEDMKALGIPSNLYHPVSNMIFCSPNREAHFLSDNPRYCLVNVSLLYQYLARKASEAGAEIRVRHTVDNFITGPQGIRGVVGKNFLGKPFEIRSDMVVDASGFSRMLATRAGLGNTHKSHAFGAEYDLYAPRFPQDSIYVIMSYSNSPQGYAWAAASGEDRVRVGVGIMHIDQKHDARAYLDSVMQLPQLKNKLRGSSQIGYHTGLFPAVPPLSRFSHDGLLFVGDVAAQGSTVIGEGIRYAMYSAQLAGKVAAEAIEAQDTSAQFLERFDSSWQSRFGRELEIAYAINRTLASFKDRDWDSAVEVLNRLTADQLAALLHGDFTPKLGIEILARSPSLLTEIGKLLTSRFVASFKKMASIG